MASFFLHAMNAMRNSGTECSLNELRLCDEVKDLGAIQACIRLEHLIGEQGLELFPPIREGDLDDKRVLRPITGRPELLVALERALENGESYNTEFKESFYLKKGINYEKVPKEHWVSDEIVFSSVKAICSFLNSDGGTLLIGVADDGTVCGVDCEYPCISERNGNADSWQLFFADKLDALIYDFKRHIGLISYGIIEYEGCSVCVVRVARRSSRLAVCRHTSGVKVERVFVRNGASCSELFARDIEALLTERLSTPPAP